MQHVGASARGWIRADHRPFIDTTADLLAGRVVYPLRLGPSGTDVGLALSASPTARVATGQSSDGGIGNTCSNWTAFAAPGLTYTGGLSTSIGPRALDGLAGTCTTAATTASVYCLGTDYTSPLPARPIPAGGRRAFTSRELVNGSSYTPSVTCNNEAADAGLPGTYEALRADKGLSACSKFTLTGGTWYRVDGAQLFPDAGMLCQPAGPPAWLTAPGRLATGASLQGAATTLVWTGAQATGVAGTNDFQTCFGWNDSTAGGYESWTGEATDSLTFFNDVANTTRTCDNTFALYCFQK